MKESNKGMTVHLTVREGEVGERGKYGKKTLNEVSCEGKMRESERAKR